MPLQAHYDIGFKLLPSVGLAADRSMAIISSTFGVFFVCGVNYVLRLLIFLVFDIVLCQQGPFLSCLVGFSVRLVVLDM